MIIEILIPSGPPDPPKDPGYGVVLEEWQLQKCHEGEVTYTRKKQTHIWMFPVGTGKVETNITWKGFKKCVEIKNGLHRVRCVVNTSHTVPPLKKTWKTNFKNVLMGVNSCTRENTMRHEWHSAQHLLSKVWHCRSWAAMQHPPKSGMGIKNWWLWPRCGKVSLPYSVRWSLPAELV